MPYLLMAAMIGQLFLRHIFNWEEISRGWFLFRNLTKDRPTFQSNIKSRYCNLELQRITHIYSIYLYSCMYVWKQTCYVLHMSIVKSVKAKSASHQPSTLGNSDTVRVISLRYLWDTLHNTNNLVPVMLCQYPCTQDRCCYYFVISTFHTSWRTSEILLPCARTSTNDRTVGKEQQICYHWQRAVIDSRAGEHPQHNRLRTVLKV